MGTSQEELVVKNPPANAGDIRDMGSIPESGRSPGRRHGNPLQYSCLENSCLEPGRLQSIGLQRVGHFMGNRWGNSGNSVKLYFSGLQNYYRW